MTAREPVGNSGVVEVVEEDEVVEVDEVVVEVDDVVVEVDDAVV